MGRSSDFNIKEELKKLPATPGVYLMHNELDEIIYVGKAIKLKNRVRQYFQSENNKTEKIRQMVKNIAWFEYILTDSEMEALVLECNLIKEYRPRYNTMLTDDKGYPFIKITLGEKYPKVLMSRLMKKDENRYFGPYTSAYAVKETLELLHKLFKIRTCNRVFPRDEGKERPCLNYHMGQCMAPCTGTVPVEEYRENIRKIMDFLSGNYGEILKDLTEKMQASSDENDFEEAIRYRDLLTSVKHVAEKQRITDVKDPEDRDIIALARGEQDAVVAVFFVRDGKLQGRDHFHMKGIKEETDRTVLSSFVKQFYAGTPFVPREILLPLEISDMELMTKYLSEKRGKKVVLTVPKRGQKEQLLELANKNAENVLHQDGEKIRREEMRTLGAVREIELLTGLSDLHRMEAFDISNISGFESVGSMVVFEDGKPKKNEYRKFRIRTVTGPNDYASMEEVLTRRFEHGLREQDGHFSVFPDLILMDGGKGQVHIAEQVLQKLNLSIPVCGMVKDDHHHTRGLFYREEELPIDSHSEGFLLITRIQDEAHRFAITYHRGLHTKNSIQSVLQKIPGVGEKREKVLMRSFDSLEDLRNATVKEIAALEGFNERVAEQVYDYLRRTS